MSSKFFGSQKALAIVALLLIVALMASAVLAAPTSRQDEPFTRLQQQSEGALKIDFYAVTGVARFARAEGGVLTREFAGQHASPEATARAFLTAYGDLFGVADQALQLQLGQVEADELGMQHVRFTQAQNGLPVFGADLIVHLDADDAVRAANGYFLPDAPALNTQATLSAKEAAKIALAQAGLGDGFVAESSLVIFNPGLITDQPSDTYLTYGIRADSAVQPHLAQWVFVDAHSGAVRFTYDAVTDGRNRSTYNMKHRTNYSRAVLARSEGSPPVTSAPSCTANDVNHAHDYAGDTYDFYWNRFGRDSYNGSGGALKSYVCYGNNYQNAFWDGSRMTYGDGFADADDVVAHELTHGVTEYSSGLIYSYQSGALNESYSDIFGEAVDLTNTGGNDSASVRWDMGEDIPGIGAIRDMMDPTRFGDPDWTGSSYYYCGSSDSGGVHSNSGVPNKAFALMVDGGSFRGYTVGAIGMDKAVQVQYRTNNYYLTASAKLLDNYNGLNQSCADLYGAGSSDCANVLAALEAVKMNGPICGAGGATPTPSGATPTPTNTPTPGPQPTATPTPTTPPGSPLVNGNFESGPFVGWSEYSSNGYGLVTTGSAHSGSWRAWLGGANNETSEISQNYTVAAGGGTLYYWYAISSSDWCGYDFGYVQVNSTTLKTYNLCSSNATSGYVQGSVSLNAYAGQTVTLKFRSTTDYSYSSSFYIDDVSFTAGALRGPVDDPHASTGPAAPQPKPDTPQGLVNER